jgi:hypothetical protein
MVDMMRVFDADSKLNLIIALLAEIFKITDINLPLSVKILLDNKHVKRSSFRNFRLRTLNQIR